jgi:hypothetical protein
MRSRVVALSGLEAFMAGFFNFSETWEKLDLVIDEFRGANKKLIDDFIKLLEDIMEKARYEYARKIIKEYGMRKMSRRRTEEFIRYVYARLKNKKPRLTLKELFKIR